MTIAKQIQDILDAADSHQIHAVYAGIGSRKTPQDILALMKHIADRLGKWGWMLRSGGANGADEAFFTGAWCYEIYVPWAGFNNIGHGAELVRPTPKAMEIAAQYHPGWKNLREPVQKLHARNVHQILGADCNSPCSMVICWTPDGSTGITTARTGGTGQAIRIAAAHKVPIFNLQREDHRAAWEEVLR